MRMFGLVIACVSLVTAMGLSSSVEVFLNLPSALIVISVGFGTLLFAHGQRSFDLLARALTSSIEASEAADAAVVAQSASKSFHCAGILGFIIGLVAMLANLDDPSAIGPAVAVTLLTVFYSVAVSTLLWNPTERRMRALAMEHSEA